MNWIAFTGLATAFTGIAILITVFIGIRQLRHLKTAMQLDGTLRLLDHLYAPKLLGSLNLYDSSYPSYCTTRHILTS